MYVLYAHLGGGGEGGVPPAGPGQVSITIWHEEAPENYTHVLWSTLYWADESLWKGTLYCSEGKHVVILCFCKAVKLAFLTFDMFLSKIPLECVISFSSK